MMTSLKPLMRRYGQTQRHTLPQVAIDIAQRAQNGEIDVEDTNDLYLEYYRASQGVTSADPTSQAMRVNASKLRQIIKTADPELLREVSEQFDTMRHRVKVRPLYHAMVDVCRYKLETGRHPSKHTIARILRAKPTK